MAAGPELLLFAVGVVVAGRIALHRRVVCWPGSPESDRSLAG